MICACEERNVSADSFSFHRIPDSIGDESDTRTEQGNRQAENRCPGDRGRQVRFDTHVIAAQQTDPPR